MNLIDFVTTLTLRKTNMAPDKWCLGDYFHFVKAYFQGLLLLVILGKVY